MMSSRYLQSQHPNVLTANSMECEWMLLVTQHIPYLLGLSDSLFNGFIDFYIREVVS